MITVAPAIIRIFGHVKVRNFARTTGSSSSGNKAIPATAARQNAAASGCAFPSGPTDNRAKIAAEDTAINAGNNDQRARDKLLIKT